jgi:hypothetical protein
MHLRSCEPGLEASWNRLGTAFTTLILSLDKPGHVTPLPDLLLTYPFRYCAEVLAERRILVDLSSS